MSRKSETCFSSKGEALSEYSSEREAQDSADYQRSVNGLELYPYQCRKCGLFHLAPKESKVDIIEAGCSCVDSYGNCKTLYATRKDAQKVAQQRMKNGSGQLNVYPCPCGSGYHLTHKTY